MVKKLKDIKVDQKTEKIDLQGQETKSLRKREQLKKSKNLLYKKVTPINAVKDLNSGKEEHYLYIKGKNFRPPKFLGNIIKIGTFGVIILIIINTINVYFTGKTLETDISAITYEGYNYLVDAGKSATQIQFDNALASFDKALGNFDQAESELWFISQDTSFYAKDNSVSLAANSLLEGGKHFALAGKYFLDALEDFNKIPLYFVSKNDTDNSLTPSITDVLKSGLEKTDQAIIEIAQASDKINQINEENLPPEVRSRVNFAKTKVAEVSTVLNATAKHFPAILKLLGDKHPHRFLILMQNNNEIRATGGFIGSYAILDLNDGYIEKLEVHDVYQLDGSYGGYIEPPEELEFFTSNWRFRDSNYSQDFPTSAKKARWFLDKEGGPTVDTVIAINQGLLKDMLDISGPVQVGDFGALNSENYNLLLSFIIEGKIWGKEDPKHILKVFVPAFKEAILKEENVSKVMSKLYKAVQQKHVMMYSSDEDIQELFSSLGVEGSVHISAPHEDYLSIINTNISGTKSEQFIEEQIDHITHIDELGNLINEVKVSRSHMWTDDIYFNWKKILRNYGFDSMPDQLIDLLGRGTNTVNIRIYVPSGATILETNASDIMTKYDKNLKKTYFFTELSVDPGQTEDVWVKYRLPFTLQFAPLATYKLVVEKQPGSIGSIFNKTVFTSAELTNVDAYPSDIKIDNSGNASYSTNLVYDRYFSGIWSSE